MNNISFFSVNIEENCVHPDTHGVHYQSENPNVSILSVDNTKYSAFNSYPTRCYKASKARHSPGGGVNR